RRRGAVLLATAAEGPAAGAADRDPPRALLRLCQLALHRAAGVVRVARVALGAQLRQRPQEIAALVLGLEHQEQVEQRVLRRDPLELEGEYEALDACAKADPRRRRPADLLHEVVVPSAAADRRRLHALVRPDELERRPRVVVEAADEGRLDGVLD